MSKYFNEHLYIFKYEGLIRNKILSYKFGDKPYLYKTFVNFLIKDKKVFAFLKRYDIIHPVPISKKRFKERGYNQSELLARQIAKLSHLKLVTNCLYKNKNIVAQSTLRKEEREKNIKDVFGTNKKYLEKIKNEKILILDDIYTTGSTVNECARMLSLSDIKNIGIITIAKD